MESGIPIQRGEAQLSVIKAWKEQKITKVINKTQKKLLEISGWENKKTTKIESELAKIQRKMDIKKMEKAEKLRSKKQQFMQKHKRKRKRFKPDALKRSLMQKKKLLGFKPRDRFPTSHLSAASDISGNMCYKLSLSPLSYVYVPISFVCVFLLVLVMDQECYNHCPNQNLELINLLTTRNMQESTWVNG